MDWTDTRETLHMWLAIVGKFETLPFSHGGYKKGVKPADLR